MDFSVLVADAWAIIYFGFIVWSFTSSHKNRDLYINFHHSMTENDGSYFEASFTERFLYETFCVRPLFEILRLVRRL